ncbi:C40 family peptidase [Streptomyces avicenniae]|uniref:C40 family peptidase n=1 Tax=Streptomyces avicenniae TaxID=500153 RepID=UPI000AC0ACB6|nr:C40 family peptidase [Streptomyces avicenniae]
MAQHRRRRWGAGAHRTAPLRTAAATLTLAGAPLAVGGAAVAAPEPSVAEVRQQVDELHHEAEEATEAYNAATETAADAEEELDRLRDQAARRTDDLNAVRRGLGSQARAAYRASGLPPSVQLALASDPEEYLERAAALDRAGTRQADAITTLNNELLAVHRLQAEAEETALVLTDALAEAEEQQATIERRLAEAEDLLAGLTEAERAATLAEESSPVAASGGGGGGETGAAPLGASAAREASPSARAAAAVGFAYAQLGKPYGWGATGPDAYDCSGLTQAAWRAAGVSLPRTSYSQVGVGARVSREQLAPGDLVFYYSGLSHVGIYVGEGQIIHAARSGTPVRLAPVDSMPLVAATRPA